MRDALRRLRIKAAETGTRDGRCVWLFTLLFLLGALSGAATERLSGAQAFFARLESLGAQDLILTYFALLWMLAWPCLCAVFLSSSTIGFLLLPVLFIICGHGLAAGAAALLASGASVAQLLLAPGLSALLALLALFSLAESSFSASLALYRGRGSGGETQRPRSELAFAGSLLLAGALIYFLILIRTF